MAEKRMMLLINPNAGRGGYKNVLGGVLETFCAGGWLPTVYFTRRSGEAPGLVAERAADYDMVVCMGGDGTLSETCAGMMRLPPASRRPVGYLPLGTTNDVARTLGISPRPAIAARSLLAGGPYPYDVGQFGPDRYFTYIAAFGAFTEVSYATPHEVKQALGHLAYLLEGLRHLGSIRECHAIVEHDGGAFEGDFIFGAVTNATSVAGLVRLDSGRVDLSDGMFEALFVRPPADILQFGELITSILSGDLSGGEVVFLKSREIRIMFDRDEPWTLDGEDGGAHRDVLIRNCHPGVTLVK